MTGEVGAAGVDTDFRAAVVAVVIAVLADCEDAARTVAEGAGNGRKTVLRQFLSPPGNLPEDIALAHHMEWLRWYPRAGESSPQVVTGCLLHSTPWNLWKPPRGKRHPHMLGFGCLGGIA